MIGWHPYLKKPGSPFAKVGDKMECINGHIIATMAQDLYTHSVISPSAFYWLNVDPVPASGTLLTAPRCRTCNGHVFFNKSNGGFAIIVNGKFVP